MWLGLTFSSEERRKRWLSSRGTINRRGKKWTKNEPNLGPKILKNFGFLSWWKVLTDFVYVLEAVALQVRCKQTEKLI